MPQTKL